MDLSDALLGRCPGYIFPGRVGRLRSHPAGPPRPLDRSVPARCPQPPRKVQWVLAYCFPTDRRLHPSRRTGRLRIAIEAESGSLTLRLTGSPSDTPVPLLEPTLVRLHAELLSVHK